MDNQTHGAREKSATTPENTVATAPLAAVYDRDLAEIRGVAAQMDMLLKRQKALLDRCRFDTRAPSRPTQQILVDVEFHALRRAVEAGDKETALAALSLLEQSLCIPPEGK